MNDKLVEITGTNNRYQIKKLKKESNAPKLRKASEKLGLSSEFFLIEKQSEIIDILYNNTVITETPVLLSQLDAKLSGYKHQDLLKKRYDEVAFIKITEVIAMLFNCELKCHYCNEKTFILYDLARETKQWTLDRINNDLGHNSDNVLISCLECNLKRRRTGKDAFLFTKQLNIIKS
jgi:uncharacterized Fe-S cluster-containing radical SAM superfamily protein